MAHHKDLIKTKKHTKEKSLATRVDYDRTMYLTEKLILSFGKEVV